jgi:hypothetical protein
VWYRSLADLVLVVHVGFVGFVVLGGVLVWRWPGLAWAHVPAVAWAVLIEFSGWICPLTPLEIALRQRGGAAGYAGDFIGHYLTAAIYPEGLSRGVQIVLGALVVLGNVSPYVVLVLRRRRRGDVATGGRLTAPGDRRGSVH